MKKIYQTPNTLIVNVKLESLMIGASSTEAAGDAMSRGSNTDWDED